VAVFKRKLFYLGGFDPRGARHYHALYVQAAEKRGGIAVSERRRAGPHVAEWNVTADGADGRAETSYAFLEWDDLVRRAWTRNPIRLLAGAARAYAGQLKHRDRDMVRRLPRGPVIAFAYPLLAVTLLPLLLGIVPFGVALVWLPWWAALLVGVLGGAALAVPLVRRVRAGWMLRFFAYNARAAGGEGDPALAERLDLFADRIAAALAEDRDELLLVTHSNGSILAVPLMARLLERHGSALPARFTLVTLGQCIPLVLSRTDRPAFRDRLAAMGRGHFQWLDIGSPPDGAAFHGVNPMALAGLDQRFLLEQLSPRFHLFRDRARAGWADKYELHFDYLRAGDRPSPLDYPSITALPRTIDTKVDAFRALP
jgi:hypothetical protein